MFCTPFSCYIQNEIKELNRYGEERYIDIKRDTIQNAYFKKNYIKIDLKIAITAKKLGLPDLANVIERAVEPRIHELQEEERKEYRETHEAAEKLGEILPATAPRRY